MLAGASSHDARLVQAAGGPTGRDGRRFWHRAVAAPTYAALANGGRPRLRLRRSSPPMIGHPSVPLVSAMISAAQRPVSGREMIAAFVGSGDAAGLGRRMNPAHYEAGWRHRDARTLGATVAAGRIAG